VAHRYAIVEETVPIQRSPGGTMVVAKAVDPSGGVSPATPAITVTQVGVVIGAGFLPGCHVTVKITHQGVHIDDYVSYAADPNGFLYADLPSAALTGVLQISATDHRPDEDGRCGRLWSNTCTLSVADR
jgi:hypothetical protein